MTSQEDAEESVVGSPQSIVWNVGNSRRGTLKPYDTFVESGKTSIEKPGKPGSVYSIPSLVPDEVDTTSSIYSGLPNRSVSPSIQPEPLDDDSLESDSLERRRQLGVGPTTVKQKFSRGLRTAMRPFRNFYESPLFGLWMMLLFSIILLALLILFKDVVGEYAVAFAKYARKHKIPGLAIMIGLHFVTSFPPMVGYGLLSYISGFIFGLAWGFLPVLVGAWAGACACFALTRWYISSPERRPLNSTEQNSYGTSVSNTQQLTQSYPQFDLVQSIMAGKAAFKLLMIIRLSPYPFALFNLLFACTSISFAQFTLGTGISLFKNILNVYIGSLFHDLADIDKRSPERWWALVGASTMATFLFFWLTWIVRQELHRAAEEREQQRQQESNRRRSLKSLERSMEKQQRKKELSRQRLLDAVEGVLEDAFEQEERLVRDIQEV